MFNMLHKCGGAVGLLLALAGGTVRAEVVTVYFWNKSSQAVDLRSFAPEGDQHRAKASVYVKTLGRPRVLLASEAGKVQDRPVSIAAQELAQFDMHLADEELWEEGAVTDHYLCEVTPAGSTSPFHLIFTGMAMEEEGKITRAGTLGQHDLRIEDGPSTPRSKGPRLTASRKGGVLIFEGCPKDEEAEAKAAPVAGAVAQR